MLSEFVFRNERMFAAAGALAVFFCLIRILFHLLRGIRTFVLSPVLGLSVNPKTLGAWAIVTGATDGIGKAYAMVLAKKGMNIVLMSRSEEKLNATAKEIETEAKVSTKCVPVDFSGGVEIYGRLEAEIEGLDIGVLVNNVGMSYDFPEFMHQVADRDHKFNQLLHVNTFPVTFMSAMVLPKMVEKRKGAIINVGSASCYGFPFLTVYSATKAFVDSLSQNLQSEYGSKGIIVQSVNPGFVATNMSRVRKSSFFIPSAISFAKSAIATLGLESVTSGCLSHWILGSLSHDLLPHWLIMKVTCSIGSSLRATALKKKAAAKKD